MPERYYPPPRQRQRLRQHSHHCPVAGCESRGLWRYGLSAHMARVHPVDYDPQAVKLPDGAKQWARRGVTSSSSASGAGSKRRKSGDGRPQKWATAAADADDDEPGGNVAAEDAAGEAPSEEQADTADISAIPAASSAASASSQAAASATFCVGDRVRKRKGGWAGTVIKLVLGSSPDSSDVTTLYHVHYDGYSANRFEELPACDYELIASDTGVSRSLRRGERLNYALLSDEK